MKEKGREGEGAERENLFGGKENKKDGKRNTVIEWVSTCIYTVC